MNQTHLTLQEHGNRINDIEDDLRILKQISQPTTPDDPGLIDVLKDMVNVLKAELLDRMSSLDDKTADKD